MTKSRVQRKPSAHQNLILLLGLPWAAVILQCPRADEAITKTHGFNFFGELKYPADYKHLDYVNPDVPKGGEISIWTMGTFDSFNLYTKRARGPLPLRHSITS